MECLIAVLLQGPKSIKDVIFAQWKAEYAGDSEVCKSYYELAHHAHIGLDFLTLSELEAHLIFQHAPDGDLGQEVVSRDSILSYSHQ